MATHTDGIADYKREERRLATLYAVTRVLSESASLAQAAPEILRNIGEGLQWDYGALWAVDWRDNVMRCVETWHPLEVEFANFEALSRETSFASGAGLPGRVWASGEPTWISNVCDDSNFPRLRVAGKEGLHAALAFPILLGDKVLGVFEFLSCEAREPDRATMEAMASLGSQIGQFIERQRVEEAVRESEVRKAAILETALDAIVSIDHEGRIIEFNPAAERTFGYSRADVIGKEMTGLIVPPSLRDAHRRGMARYLATGEGPVLGKRVELTGMRADGSEFPIELAITRIPLGGSPVFTGYIRDITERKRAEEQREELLAQVERALYLRSQFLSIASHELKTPVTLLKGYSQLLYNRMQKAGDVSVLKPIEVVRRQTDRMGSLIDELLEVSRIESGRVESEMLPFDLNAAIEEVVEDIAVTTPGFVFRMEEEARGVWIQGDRPRIQRVMTNLLMNAVKYSDDRKEADISIRRDGDQVIVSVTDYGIGIPEEQKASVFDLYFRANNATTQSSGGLGLGLYISKAIVERHGGTIQVVSEEGQGSTFYFSLPAMEAAPPLGPSQDP